MNYTFFLSQFLLFTRISICFANVNGSNGGYDDGIHQCRSTNKNGKSTYLWAMESLNGDTSYLFGTIHVPYTKVWNNVSSRVKEALELSSTVVVELNIYNRKVVDLLIRCKNMHNGDVRKYLPAKIYGRMWQYMRYYRHQLKFWSNRISATPTEARKRARNIYNAIAGEWEKRRPIWLLFLLYQLSEKFPTNQHHHSPMLDVFLSQYALYHNKSLVSIETPFEHCYPATSISAEQLIFAINYTLSYMEYESHFPTDDVVVKRTGLSYLVDKYNCGTLEAAVFNDSFDYLNRKGFTLGDELDERARQIEKLLREDIIVKRNARMAHRLANLSPKNTNERYFIALGAGHFFGEKSILRILDDYGYFTREIHNDDVIRYRQEAFRKQKFNQLWIKDKVSLNEVLDSSMMVHERTDVSKTIISISATNRIFSFLTLFMLLANIVCDSLVTIF